MRVHIGGIGQRGDSNVERMSYGLFGLAAAILASVLLGAPASAQIYLNPKFEASAGYSQFSFDAAGDDPSIGAITGRGVVDFSSFLGVEGEVSVGLFDDEGVELDSAFGLFGKGTFLVTPNVDVHARVGYTDVELSGDGVDEDDNGVAAGLGAEFYPAGKTAFRFDYLRYFLDDEADVVTLSLHRQF